jgi:hypothetical protein
MSKLCSRSLDSLARDIQCVESKIVALAESLGTPALQSKLKRHALATDQLVVLSEALAVL